VGVKVAIGAGEAVNAVVGVLLALALLGALGALTFGTKLVEPSIVVS